MSPDQAALHTHQDFSDRREAARAAKAKVRNFLMEEVTDPLNYIPGGYGAMAKWATKGLIALAGLKHSSDVEAMFWRANKAPMKLREAYMALKQTGTDTAVEIFKKTGIFSDSNNVLRYYTPDVGTQFNPVTVMAAKNSGSTSTAGTLFPKSPAFLTDPHLRDLKVRFEDMPVGNSGSYDPLSHTVILSRHLQGDEINSAFLHELQHAVQRNSNLQRGVPISGGTNIAYETKQILPSFEHELAAYKTEAASRPWSSRTPPEREALTKKYRKLVETRQAGKEAYLDNPGEMESRVTEKMRNVDQRAGTTHPSELMQMERDFLTHPDFRYDWSLQNDPLFVSP